MKSYESLSDALDDLRKRGYEADFGIETIGLYCGDLDLRLDPEDFHVDEVYPFEGNISRDDSAVRRVGLGPAAGRPPGGASELVRIRLDLLDRGSRLDGG